MGINYNLPLVLSKKYNDQVNTWIVHANEMEETLDLVWKKLMNELGEKEEVPKTLQKDMKKSY